jgi:myo-inositol-1(or 4)-monophosphatase
MDEFLPLAVELARSAGRRIVVMRDDAVASATSKSTPTDPVTAADTEAERIIVEGILDARPHDGVAGEEGTNRAGTSGVIWHIDPIDGTANFVYGIPAYSVSIGVEVDGVLTAGAVYNPVADELFSAQIGNGATLNGDPIRVSQPTDCSMALVGTGFGYNPDRRRAQGGVLAELLPAIRDVRRAGSAALDLCSVASGRLDAYYEAGLNKWDFAAGALIATEAGAVCGDLAGEAPNERFLLAAAPSIHRPLAELLKGLDADRVTDHE